jgi:hypothetical protein
VRVQGARGLAPGPAYKVSATFMDGYRCNAQLTIVGQDAARKAQRTGEAILERTRALFARLGLRDFSRTRVEVLGSEQAYYGPQARTAAVREAVLHLAVMHPQKDALELFAREIAPAGTSWSPGTTGAGGRPSPAPAIRQFGFLVDKALLAPQVVMGEAALPVAVPTGQAAVPAPAAPPVPPEPVAPADLVEVPLVRVAWGRSGDKGNHSNIGIIARRPEWLPWLRAQLTEARVKAWLGHLVAGEVTRYDVPGIHALNFLCTEALDGGGMASLRNDPLGKGMAQVLLAMPVRVPRAWIAGVAGANPAYEYP